MTVGAGAAYYQGERMSATEALLRAGLKPLAPFGADDSALESSNAYATAQAAILAAQAPLAAFTFNPKVSVYAIDDCERLSGAQQIARDR